MVTQEGEQRRACARCAATLTTRRPGVKTLFSDVALREELAARGYRALVSANSINWGRLAAADRLLCRRRTATWSRQEQIALGETVDVCVPTGNFGNILAAYYAQLHGRCRSGG